MEQNHYPRMRYVEAIPVEENNEVYIYIRDPLEIASSPLVMSPVEFYILTLMDGKHSISEIKLAFAERFGGVLVPDHQIEKLVDILESHYYLDSPNFYQRLTDIKQDFTRSTIRKAWHAGVSYPDDPTVLTDQLTGYYHAPGGAGMPDLSAGSLSAISADIQKTYPAVMAPHIDLRVGGTAYTHAYRNLWETGEAELFLIFGVAHFGGHELFTATEKDFETPLGVVPTDREFVRRWQEYAGMNLTNEEWIHRSEHSIEFQLLFLQHLWRKPFQIVPVLCGSLEPYVMNQSGDLEAIPQIRALLNGLRRAIEEESKPIAIILSVDLAHLGPKFGDSKPITAEERELIQEADYRLFDVLAKFDRDAYSELMETDLLPRRVDAVSALFTLLHLFKEGEGKLLCYEQNFQEDTQSLVTYASMAFSGKI